MFGIGGFELFIIVLFVLVVFGPKKMPEITRLAGLGIKKFRKAKSEMDKVLQEEIVDPVMKVANEEDKPVKSNLDANSINSGNSDKEITEEKE